jgi:RNA polymerase sigma factor (TIGR02999 family)
VGPVDLSKDRPANVTQLLIDWGKGNASARDDLMPLVYDELRRMARHYMKSEDRAHTLQPTALVHDAYIRLVDQNRVNWQNRAHFFGVAAQIIRRVLVDHARARHRLKRGGLALKVTLIDDIAAAANQAELDLVALDEGLNRLAELDERQSRIIELRFFGGLSIEETAEALTLSPATVKREWSMARAWLFRELRNNSDQE